MKLCFDYLDCCCFANTFLKGTAVHNEGDEVELVQPPAPPGCEVAQRQEDRGGVEGDGQGHQLHHHRPQCRLLPGSSSFFLKSQSCRFSPL